MHAKVLLLISSLLALSATVLADGTPANFVKVPRGKAQNRAEVENKARAFYKTHDGSWKHHNSKSKHYAPTAINPKITDAESAYTTTSSTPVIDDAQQQVQAVVNPKISSTATPVNPKVAQETSTILSTSTPSAKIGRPPSSSSTPSVASTTPATTTSSTPSTTSMTLTSTSSSITTSSSSSSSSAPPNPKSTSTSSSAAAATSSTSSSTSSLSTFQSNILVAHNAARSTHGANALTWSDSLTTLAKTWAEACVWEHGGANGAGQNLAAAGGTGNSASETGQQVVNSWMSEESQYDPSNPVYSHFTQVVWKASTQLGCYQASCSKFVDSTGANVFDTVYLPAVYTVCNYSPAGNVIGEFAQNVQKAS